MAATSPAVECREVRKSFGGVPVLTDVSVSFDAGTVNVLAGENGAGKSTLLNMIAGLLAPDAGSISIAGQEIGHFDPSVAHRHGVSFIPQELAPLPDMRVEENVLLGRAPRSRFGLIDRAAMTRSAGELLAQFGIDIDPRTPMRRLPVALTQIVEIAKAIGWESSVLLMDEPTAAISERETERLFTVIRRLRERGVCVVYTTHRMAEIEVIADTVCVLRDGSLVSNGPATDYTERDIVTAMIGRQMGNLFPARAPAPEQKPMLALEALRPAGAPEPVTLSVRPGEIVGLAGLVGAGRTELLEGIFGVRPAKGKVLVDGRPVRLGVPHAAIAAGIALVPEDRKNAGLVLELSTTDNTILPHLSKYLRGRTFINRRTGQREAETVAERVNLQRSNASRPVRTLSGGNQQKVVIARWLLADMRVLLLDEPTRGVDVGSRAEIYRIISQLAAAGVAVLLASSELDEVINLTHRILVMRQGRVAGEIQHDGMTDAAVKERILRLAMGLNSTDPHAERASA